MPRSRIDGFGFAGGKVVGSGRKASTVVVAFVGLVDVPESSVSLEMFVVFEHHGFVRAIEARIVVVFVGVIVEGYHVNLHSRCDVRAAALVMIQPSAIRRVISIAHNDIRMVPSLAISTAHIVPQLSYKPSGHCSVT